VASPALNSATWGRGRGGPPSPLRKPERGPIKAMKEWSGSGAARVSVTDVIAQGSFYDGFSTWRPNDPKKYWYLKIHVGVLNTSSETIHANPLHFTLLVGNHTINPDDLTFSMDAYFDAIDLQPDTYGSGWLLFLASKAEEYTLVYEGPFDEVVRQKIVVTQTK